MASTPARQKSERRPTTLDALPTVSLVELISGSTFNNRSPEKLLRDLALGHCLNEVSHLDYFQGSTAANAPLQHIGADTDWAFCDTIVVFTIVAEYHTVAPGKRENANTGVPDDVADEDMDGVFAMRRLKKSHAHVLREQIQSMFLTMGVDAVPRSKDILLQNGATPHALLIYLYYRPPVTSYCI